MIFNNHPSASILNMAGIRRSVMHQRTVSWRHVWLVKKQVWLRKEWEFYSGYKGNSDMLRTTILHAFIIDTVIVGSNGSHHSWSYISWWCVQAKLSGIYTNVTLNSVVFSHYYQYHNIKYEPAIALMNKKSKTLYQFRRTTAISLSFDNKCSHPWRQPRSALTTEAQELKSLLFGDELYFVMGNEND